MTLEDSLPAQRTEAVECSYRLALRPLTVFLAVDGVTVGFFAATDTVLAVGPPLLEEEGYGLGVAEVFEVQHPFFAHGSCLGARLSTADNPINIFIAKDGSEPVKLTQ